MAATSSTESGAVLKLASGPTEYACARRLRHKLLLSYLSQQGLHPTFQSLVRQTDAHLSAEHLRQLVAGGLWGDALDYLARFLPPGACAGDNDNDILARPILLFLHTLWTFANVAASTTLATVTSDMHLHDFTVCLSVSHSFLLRSILNLIIHKPRFRASLNWGVIRNKAASIACDLARESPELSRRLLLPSVPGTPRDVVPICPRQRRYLKRPPRRPPAHAITKLYLNKRMSLPSSTPQPGANHTESLNKVAGLIKECFKAGVSLMLLQSGQKKDDPGAPVLKTKISSLTHPAKNIGTSSVPNAGAPVSLPAKTSGTLTATDAGTINAIQGIVLRKHPRTELSASQEEPDLKRQRTCTKLATDLPQTNLD